MTFIIYLALTLALLYIIHLLSYKLYGSKRQRRLQFPQHQVKVPMPTISPSIVQIEFAVEGGKVDAWYFSCSNIAQPAILIAHGNQGLIDKNVAFAEKLVSCGLNVLLVEYPSYGRSTGKLNQANFLSSFTQAFDFLKAKNEVSNILLYGSSMGGSIAAHLLTNRTPDGLILRSSFASFGHYLARKFFLPTAIIENAFTNRGLIESFKGPFLIMHGKSDEVVDYANALTLKKIAPQAKLVSFDGGHEVPVEDDIVKQIQAFVDENGFSQPLIDSNMERV